MNIYTFLGYFLVFILYSFMGWLMEVIREIILNKKFVNRGFLLGPYCPIYGFGVLLIVFLLRNYTYNPLVLFILSMVICMVLEYLTSYFMEVIFKARWWDYSDKKFNINGRICLETTIPFGLGGTLIMYVVHPFVIGVVSKFSKMALLIVGLILLVIFITDNIISFMTIFKVKLDGLLDYTDNTEEITIRVKEYLMKHSFLTKRLVKAFPGIKMKLREYKKNRK